MLRNTREHGQKAVSIQMRYGMWLSIRELSNRFDTPDQHFFYIRLNSDALMKKVRNLNKYKVEENWKPKIQKSYTKILTVIWQTSTDFWKSHTECKGVKQVCKRLTLTSLGTDVLQHNIWTNLKANGYTH